MEINTQDLVAQTTLSPVAALPVKEAIRPAEGTRTEAAKPNSDVTKAPPPAKRPPPVLVHAVNQGLSQSGISVTDTTSVPATNAADSTATANDLERAQSEKIAQAMQAFMHALVQAANSRPQATEASATNADALQSSAAEPATTGTQSRSAADAYVGLTSRLETLARQLEGSSSPANDTSRLGDLEKTFRELAAAAANGNEGGDGARPPKLQEVVRAVARNLQSTGDPTLATSGNVINTSA